MTKRERSLKRLLTTIVEQAHARLFSIKQTNGGHMRATFSKGGGTVRMSLSATPSDIRTVRNDRAHAKRLLRGIA